MGQTPPFPNVRRWRMPPEPPTAGQGCPGRPLKPLTPLCTPLCVAAAVFVVVAVFAVFANVTFLLSRLLNQFLPQNLDVLGSRNSQADLTAFDADDGYDDGVSDVEAFVEAAGED
jgi:hypothetical protein